MKKIIALKSVFLLSCVGFLFGILHLVWITNRFSFKIIVTSILVALFSLLIITLIQNKQTDVLGK